MKLQNPKMHFDLVVCFQESCGCISLSFHCINDAPSFSSAKGDNEGSIIRELSSQVV